MICPVIQGPTIEEAQAQIQEALLRKCKIVELRLDYFQNRSLKELKKLKDEFSVEIIFTLRSKCQGGLYSQSEEDRLNEILKLAECNPDYFDLEYQIPKKFLEDFKQRYPQIKLIISYHDFNENNLEIEKILELMPKIDQSLYKIAIYSDFTTHALKTILQKQSYPELCLVNMGESGQVVRVLSTYFDNKITYASLNPNRKTAPGQLSLDELFNVYRQDTITKETKILGLIGNPVSESIGHHCHNNIFFENAINAVYVKMKIVKEELSSFFKISKKLNLCGLSVTMPHKEAILPLLDRLDETAKLIGAVNTVVFEDGQSFGYNTDGVGALNALENYVSVKGKKLIVLGAGGAARAIAYEAIKRGAIVTIINRTLKKAETTANQLGCQFAATDDFKWYFEDGYDILINCTPDPMPVDAQYLQPSAYIMDITTNPVNTLFLTEAVKMGCKTIPGFEMFVQQAIGQLQLWFPEKFDKDMLYKNLKKCALSKL